jgi:hypothetical protein
MRNYASYAHGESICAVIKLVAIVAKFAHLESK